MSILPAYNSCDLEVFEHQLASRYSSKDMVRLFSPLYRMRVWRRLWLTLAESECTLGLPITSQQIDELRASQDLVDLHVISHYESLLHHDVMAAIYAWGEQAPLARPIIHLGATSCFVTDNGDLLICREALLLLYKKLLTILKSLSLFAYKWCDTPCLSYTHFQPAQPTTVGKRATMWIQDLVIDIKDLLYVLDTTPILGIKGATGTQASFLELFNGDIDKVEALEKVFCDKIGIKPVSISGQTSTRKFEDRLGQVLCGLAASASKFACDVRLLQHLKEIEEPFACNQIGSSAMPYKQNPIRSERINSLSRFVLGLMPSSYQTTASQWLERTLDDSAHRRLTISQCFMAIDAILALYAYLASGLVVNEKIINARLMQELPFMSAEVLLMEGVKRGGDRQDLHEKFRLASLEARYKIKQGSDRNELLQLLAADPVWNMNIAELTALIDPIRFIGCATTQARRFLDGEVAVLLNSNDDSLNQ